MDTTVIRESGVMNFGLKHLLMLAVLIGILFALISTAMKFELDQRYFLIAASPDSTKIAIQGSLNTQVIDVEKNRRVAALDAYSSDYPGHLEFVDDETLMSFGFSHSLQPNSMWWHHWPSESLVHRLVFGSVYEHFAPAYDGFLYTNNTTQTMMFVSSDPKTVAPLTTSAFTDLTTSGLFCTRTNLPSFYSGSEIEIQKGSPYWTEELEIEFPVYREDETERVKVETVPVAKLPLNILLSPNGDKFAAKSNFDFSMYEKETGQLIWSIPGNHLIRFLFSSDGRFLHAEDRLTREVIVFEVESGKEMLNASTSFDYSPIPCAISNAGKLFVTPTMSSSHGVEVFDIETGEQLKTIGGTAAEQNWVSTSLMYAVWLTLWGVAWALVVPKARTITKLPKLIGFVYWYHIFAFGGLLSFGVCGYIFRNVQIAAKTNSSPSVAFVIYATVLLITALVCLVMSAQRIIGRVHGPVVTGSEENSSV